MIRTSDLYCATFDYPISADGATIGIARMRYEVRYIQDMRNLASVRTYRIECTQRVIIPNSGGYSTTPGAVTSFDSYPALLMSSTTLTVSTDAQARLVNYAPKTMNTAIMTSVSNSTGSSNSYSAQRTSGSSVSQTNTYGGSVSMGVSGEDPTGSVSADYSHSSTTETSSSLSHGTDVGTNAGRDLGDQITVKDWGAYANLDSGGVTPTWVWGQEYPWDVIQYRNCDSNNVVALPDFVVDRLYEDPGSTSSLVFPPSQLSLFGIDFTMKAHWMIDLPAALTDQVVNFAHTLGYMEGSHGNYIPQTGAAVQQATLEQRAIEPFGPASSFDLTLLGLDPIVDGSAKNGAVIGFIAQKFIVAPSGGAAFKIISEANNLQVTGSGFDDVMSTSFSENGQATLTFNFKVVDTIHEYALYFKHWNTSAVGCAMSITVNDNDPLVRHVDTQEGEGGDNNMLAITLRNRDYSSIDYHDYLQLGMNTIVVTITPDTANAGAGYYLRALAIGAA
ncbi:hypothetical protein [Cupriavidus sp. CP313]